ncbi:MAG: NHL repeat-containing protein [Ignavibacteriae bacterium]|nr:NHL repeat-containing protein [Ignavibacteriota bacterium]
MKKLFQILFCFSVGLIWCHGVILSQKSSNKENLFDRTFQEAVALTIDPSGNIYVLDRGTSEVYKFSSQGNLLQKIGGHGWSVESFDKPSDVFTSNGLDIYVADYGNHRVQRFDRNLNYISSLSLRDEENQTKRFGYPKSIAVDRFGALYIVDGENIRIIKLKGDEVERTFGGIDAGKGRLQNPQKIRITSDDKVYVLDGNSIVVFDIFGNYVQSYPERMFAHHQAIGLSDENLVVVDSCRFKSFGKIDVDSSFMKSIKNVLCEAIDAVFTKENVFVLTKKGLYEYGKEKLFIEENEK